VTLAGGDIGSNLTSGRHSYQRRIQNDNAQHTEMVKELQGTIAKQQEEAEERQEE